MLLSLVPNWSCSSPGTMLEVTDEKGQKGEKKRDKGEKGERGGKEEKREAQNDSSFHMDSVLVLLESNLTLLR